MGIFKKKTTAQELTQEEQELIDRIRANKKTPAPSKLPPIPEPPKPPIKEPDTQEIDAVMDDEPDDQSDTSHVKQKEAPTAYSEISETVNNLLKNGFSAEEIIFTFECIKQQIITITTQENEE